MRKALTILGASLSLALVTSALAQLPPDSFKDVPSEHWAYQSVDALRAKGILVGYPDGLYRGKRTLTRYEFAVALKRALDQIQATPGDKGPAGAPGQPGPAGAAGEAGPAGPKGDSGIGPEELAALKKLLDEFKAELSNLGVNVNAINAKLDKLARDVAALKTEIAGMPKITGGMYVGIRADRANGLYVDRDGVALSNLDTPMGGGVWKSMVNTPVVLHQFNLNVTKSWGDAGTLKATIVNSNYKGYLNDLTAIATGAPLNTSPRSDTYLDQLVMTAPFAGIGREGNLTLGRFGFALTPLTLSKISVDSYLTNPLVDDGKLRMDGFNLTTKLGSVGVNAFAGQTSRPTGTDGMPFSAPIAGASGFAIFAADGGLLAKPLAQVYNGQMLVDQVGGVELKLPLNMANGAHVGVRAALATGTDGVGFNNVQTIGADAGVKLSETVNLTAEWAKTNTGTGRLGSVNVHDNNAYTGNLELGTLLGVNMTAGYKYVDPLFYAPGFWGKIGNWFNPTNVQGPSLRMNKDLTPNMGLTLGGDYVFAARDRAAAYSLGKDDEIWRALAGLKWDVSESLTASVDWEGVYWKLQGKHGAIGSAATLVHPVEHYITLGAGYKWNDAANIKLGYQLGSFNGHGFLTAGGGLSGYNYNTFTSTVNVKF